VAPDDLLATLLYRRVMGILMAGQAHRESVVQLLAVGKVVAFRTGRYVAMFGVMA